MGKRRARRLRPADLVATAGNAFIKLSGSPVTGATATDLRTTNGTFGTTPIRHGYHPYFKNEG